MVSIGIGGGPCWSGVRLVLGLKPSSSKFHKAYPAQPSRCEKRPKDSGSIAFDHAGEEGISKTSVIISYTAAHLHTYTRDTHISTSYLYMTYIPTFVHCIHSCICWAHACVRSKQHQIRATVQTCQTCRHTCRGV